MIKKLTMLALFSLFSYGNGVVELEKESGECKIIKNSGKQIDCSKNDTYFLDIGDRVKSKKIQIEDFTYITGSSLVFVLNSDSGYRVLNKKRGFLMYLKYAYNNFMNPNKNSSQGGVNGGANNRYKLKSKTKIIYGDRLEVNINKEDIENIKRCLLEDSKENEIKQGYSCSKQKIIIDSNKLDKKKEYELFIVGKREKSIKFSFVDKEDIQSIQNRDIEEQSDYFSKFTLYIYQINQKEER